MRHREHEEQAILVEWLRRAEILHCAVPNSAKRTPFQAKWLKDEGMSAGAPDLLIFSLTPSLIAEGVRGVAIEMKAIGGKPSDAQLRWREQLMREKWVTNICYGAAAALSWLAKLGYNVPSGVINDRFTSRSNSGTRPNQENATRKNGGQAQA